MNLLLKELNEYLALRRGLGFKLREHESVLRKFVVFLQARSVEFVTTCLALEWAQQPQHASQAHRARRLGMARDFAQYLSARDPRTQVPPQGLLPGKTRRAQPYIYSDAQILRLVQAAARLEPRDGFRPRTYGAVLGLLAVTGMRVGEVVGLKDPDVDLRQGLLTVRHTAAMNLLHAGADTSTIALWLGHENLETVHIYVEADLAKKQEILAKTAAPTGSVKRYRPDDALLAFLKGL